MADGEAVPVDLSGWFDGSSEQRKRIAEQVDEACIESGFLAITGHGIDDALLTEMMAVTTAFFDQPVEAKLAARTGDLVGNRGYVAEGSEALSYSLGIESPPDLFEAFNAGRQVPPPGESDESIAHFFAPNVWPDAPVGMRQVWLDYYAACEQLGVVLLDVFAMALDLPDGWFHRFVDRSPNVIRANNYQRREGAPPPAPDQQRMGAHADYGSLTILLADRVAGLQIRDQQGGWHDVMPPENGFLVNLGDLLAEWTNDRWRATVHRVVPPPASATGAVRRRSIAFFQQPNHDSLIEVLDSCIGPDNPARYPPVSAGAHLLDKLMGPREHRPSDTDEAFKHE